MKAIFLTIFLMVISGHIPTPKIPLFPLDVAQQLARIHVVMRDGKKKAHKNGNITYRYSSEVVVFNPKKRTVRLDGYPAIEL